MSVKLKYAGFLLPGMRATPLAGFGPYLIPEETKMFTVKLSEKDEKAQDLTERSAAAFQKLAAQSTAIFMQQLNAQPKAALDAHPPYESLVVSPLAEAAHFYAMGELNPYPVVAAHKVASENLNGCQIGIADYDYFSTVLTGYAARIKTLEEELARLTAAEEPGNHPYNGPVKDGKSVPDEVHERFHRGIGDVLAGKVMSAARKQMQEALKNAPKDKPEFPVRYVESDPRRIGR